MKKTIIALTILFPVMTIAAEKKTITATGSTLHELTTNLQNKAKSKGATNFKIIAAGGNNFLSGTAIIEVPRLE